MYNTKNLVILLAIIVIAVIIYLVFSKQKENLTVDQTKKDKLANDIVKFLKKDTEYKEYLDFLTKIPYNLSIKILDQEVFYEMKFLLKNKKLNANEIKKYITDM